MPPGAGNRSAGNNGGGNGPQFVGGTPGFFPTSSPGRSANNVNWPTFSNPLARLQSQGHRSLLCGAIGAVNSLMAWGHQLSPHEVQRLIGASIIVGSLVATGGSSLPYILLGGALGAGIGYGAQAWQNVWQKGMTLAQALNPQNIDRKVVVEAAFQGAVSGAVAGVVDSILPVGGSGLGKVLMTAAVEAVSGRAERIAVNLSTGRPWDENLLNPHSGAWWKEVALDILPGVGATVLKPALKGLKRGIAGAVGGL